MHNKLILDYNAIMILSGCKENFPAILHANYNPRKNTHDGKILCTNFCETLYTQHQFKQNKRVLIYH